MNALEERGKSFTEAYYIKKGTLFQAMLECGVISLRIASRIIYTYVKALTLLTYVFDITSKIEFKILFGDILTVPDKYTVSPYPVTFLTADDLITDAEILTHTRL